MTTTTTTAPSVNNQTTENCRVPERKRNVCDYNMHTTPEICGGTFPLLYGRPEQFTPKSRQWQKWQKTWRCVTVIALFHDVATRSALDWNAVGLVWKMHMSDLLQEYRQNNNGKHANDEWVQFSYQHCALEFLVCIAIFKQPFARGTISSTFFMLGKLNQNQKAKNTLSNSWRKGCYLSMILTEW